MSEKKLLKIYGLGGLTESMQIIKMDMAGPEHPEVFFGVATRSPRSSETSSPRGLSIPRCFFVSPNN
jgi:hypothetical protein